MSIRKQAAKEKENERKVLIQAEQLQFAGTSCVKLFCHDSRQFHTHIVMALVKHHQDRPLKEKRG